MRTTYLLNATLVAVLAMSATSCTNELTNEQTPNHQGKSMSIIAGVPTEADTRLSYDDATDPQRLILNWKTDDKLSVYRTDFAATATPYTLNANATNTKNGTFSTTNSPTYTDNDKLIAIYPQSTYTGDTNGLQLSVANQSGVLTASPHHYMQAITTYKTDETPAFTFSHLMAVVKLELVFSDQTTGNKVSNISLCGSGLFDKAVMATDGTLTKAANVNAVVSTASTEVFTLNDEKKAVVYLFVFPTTVSNAKVTATCGSTNYEFKLADAALEKGNVYKVAATITEATANTWYGDGSATDYYIYNEQDLRYFAATVNSGKGMNNKTVHLLADIDLGNREHNVIGKSSSPFKGTFEGNSRTVSNITINKPNTDNQGFFGHITTGTIIKDLTVTGNITGKEQVAGIAAYVEGAIINCVNKANVTGTGYVGGIAAFAKGIDIIACENYGTITSTGSDLGGITAGGAGYLIACINHGDVTGQYYIGGIAGNLNGATAEMYACINEGTITGSLARGGVIGLAANYSEIKASYFTNNSSLKFAGNDNKNNGWNTVEPTSYTDINSTATIEAMNTAINKWNTAQTDEFRKCPYFQASTTPGTALPTLVKQP